MLRVPPVLDLSTIAWFSPDCELRDVLPRELESQEVRELDKN
jgi:hypothetical protein